MHEQKLLKFPQNFKDILSSLYLVGGFGVSATLSFWLIQELADVQAFVHKEALLQKLNFISWTMPNMSLIESIWANFSSLFDCHYLDGGNGRFRYVGYLYEMISANMTFLGILPSTLFDYLSLYVVIISSLFLYLYLIRRTNSVIIASLAVIFFLVSYPVIMIFEFHYRGPKIIAVFFLALFLFLFNEYKNQGLWAKWPLIFSTFLGVLSDPFFILASSAIVFANEVTSFLMLNGIVVLKDFFKRHANFKIIDVKIMVRKNIGLFSCFLGGYYFGGPIFALAGAVIGHLIDFKFVTIKILKSETQCFLYTCVCSGFFVIAVQGISDIVRQEQLCSLILGLGSAASIKQLTNFLYSHYIPASLLGVPNLFFGLFVIAGLIFLAVYKCSKQENSFIFLGTLLSIVLFSQLWPNKNLESLAYSSYYGLIPQLLLAAVFGEAISTFRKGKNSFFALSFGGVLIAILFFNLAHRNPVSSIYNAWVGGHFPEEQRTLWDKKYKEIEERFEVGRALGTPTIIEVPDANDISYSAMYGSTQNVSWVRHTSELEYVIPMIYAAGISDGSIITVPKRFSHLVKAKEVSITPIDETVPKRASSSRNASGLLIFELTYPDGRFNARLGNQQYKREHPSYGGFLVSKKVFAGMTSKVVAILYEKNTLEGKNIPLCRIEIPPYTPQTLPENVTYSCNTKKRYNDGELGILKIRQIGLPDTNMDIVN
jgi:hypothetical protein